MSFGPAVLQSHQIHASMPPKPPPGLLANRTPDFLAMHPETMQTGCIDSLCHSIGAIGTVIWDRPVSDPDVDQLLHWLEIPICQQAVKLTNADEKAE